MTKAQGEQKLVSISELRESPTNPRKTFGDLSELVASVKRHGILQPLLARPTDDGLELVFGHRRLRAAKEAGLKQIPVIVREMEPDRVLEEQLVENVQRMDIHPMEEAEAYERLHAEFGYSVDDIADRVGKTRASVYARMKLCDLSQTARKAFFRGDLDASRALLIARLKGENTQVRALEAITKKDRRGDMMSFRAAAEFVQNRFGKASREAEESGSGSKSERKAKAADEDSTARCSAARSAITAAVAAMEKKADLETVDLRLMIHGLAGLIPLDAIMERRGYERPEHLANAAAKKLSEAELRGLLFEMALTNWVGDSADGFTVQLKTMAKTYGINLRELEAGAKYEMDQAAKKEEAEALFAKVSNK